MENYASNVFASPYEQLYTNANANGMLSPDTTQTILMLTSRRFVSISSAQYYCDYYCQNSGPRIALVGGVWDGGSFAGPWYWFLGASSSDAHVGVGGRLVRKAV